jgi:hypothetical protein
VANQKSFDSVTVEVFDANLLVPSALHDASDAHGIVAVTFVDLHLVSAVDVARAVSGVLDDAGPHIGKIYNLTGFESADLEHYARAFSKALGRTIRYRDVPLSAWSEGLLGAGMPAHVAKHPRISRFVRLSSLKSRTSLKDWVRPISDIGSYSTRPSPHAKQNALFEALGGDETARTRYVCWRCFGRTISSAGDCLP